MTYIHTQTSLIASWSSSKIHLTKHQRLSQSYLLFAFLKMKQKIVIKLCMDCEKARSKAMKIAADSHGVTSVAVEIDKNQLVVTGNGVDIACLTSALRKKVAPATIVTVTEVKSEDKKKKEEKKKLLCCPQKQFCCAQYPACSMVYEQEPPLCTVM